MARKKKDPIPQEIIEDADGTEDLGKSEYPGNPPVAEPCAPDAQTIIQRIGYKEGYVTIDAEEHVAGTDYKKEIKLRSAEAPHPDFAASFAALADGARKLLQVPPSWAKDAITITKISLGDNGGVRGASITGKAALETSDSPFNFATPYLPFSVEGESNRPIMPPDILAHIRTAETHALDYLKGNRAQNSLPL
ncbi:MAG: hypothetical protein ACLP7P_08445 [Rhodomicrobium sp.]